MTNFSLQVKVGPNGTLPTRGSPEAAGYDLYAAEDFLLYSGTTVVVPLDIQVQIPEGWVGIIKDRSSMGAKGITVFGGVIDSDYRGEWKVILHRPVDMKSINSEDGKKVPKHNKGDRIAQVVFVPCGLAVPQPVTELSETVRGDGHLGSTGV